MKGSGRFFILTKGPEGWKRFLAKPEKQRRSGYSAKALSYFWEEADGFPESVKRVFSNADCLSRMATSKSTTSLFAVSSGVRYFLTPKTATI